jgi:hypothetical protein
MRHGNCPICCRRYGLVAPASLVAERCPAFLKQDLRLRVFVEVETGKGSDALDRRPRLAVSR